jgi:sugar lactone lactonase YvrE
MYIADTYSQRIRKVFTNGTIATVAGNGTVAFGGDGGPATNAAFNYPIAIAFDTFGNLFIADYQNDRVRKVLTNGTVTTVASSIARPSGLVFDATGNLYITEKFKQRIIKMFINGTFTTVAGNGTQGYGGDGGPATSAALNYPEGIALDTPGNLYIADFSNQRVRVVYINGTIATVAGNGSTTFTGDGGPATSASLFGPAGVRLDTSGNLFIGDQHHQRIRKVFSNGTITTFAGTGVGTYSGDNGPATNAGLYYPITVAFDTLGSVFIAAEANQRIRVVQH